VREWPDSRGEQIRSILSMTTSAATSPLHKHYWGKWEVWLPWGLCPLCGIRFFRCCGHGLCTFRLRRHFSLRHT